MNTTDQFRPRRQTMQNIKPTDYVPFEDVVRTSLYLRDRDKPEHIRTTKN